MPSRSHDEMQANLGRALVNLRQADVCAVSCDYKGMSDDIFMMVVELQRLLNDSRDPRKARKLVSELSYVSQSDQETLWPRFHPQAKS